MNRRTAISTLALAAAPAIAGPVGLRLPGGFDPRQIPGLQLWLDASQIVGLSDGDAVATWSDLSGNGYNATQGTASKQPTYQTAEVNGKPCVRFDGVDDFLRNSTFSVAQPLTAICVSKQTVGGSLMRMFDGSSSRVLIGEQSANQLAFFAGSTVVIYTRATPWPWSYYTGVFNGAASEQFLNGTTLGAANPGAQSLIDLRVGCGYFNAIEDEFWNGDIAELIIYNSALSAANLALLHAYIASKYGL